MGFFAKWRIHKQAREQGRVEVSEKDGVHSFLIQKKPEAVP